MLHPRLQVIISRSRPSKAHLSAAFTARRHSSSLWPPSQRSLHLNSSSTRGQHTISHITFSNIPTINTVLRTIVCTFSSSRGRPLTSQTCSRQNLRATAIKSTMVLTIIMAISSASARSQVRSRAITKCSRNRINSSSLNSQYQLCLTTKRHLE